ncbi:MAG: hypothetical protein AMXMBFR56_54990 [Polyangiaceae bacterium]
MRVVDEDGNARVFVDNCRVDEDASQLTELLEGRLDEADAEALETRLERRPALRRKLADLAVLAEPTQPGRTLRIRPGPERPEPPRLEGVDVGATLGQGGMAVVRLGRQLKLDRAVAVKTLRGDRRSESDVARLLREARVTGRLEHPNIVPVHDIVRGADGVPQVVLKLIEGHTWTELMRDPERVRALFGATDLLEWNLDVLMAVARALSYAHSRGVIHRDVKPGNVMLGSFGEVYLLDWGIARDLDDPDGAEEDAHDLMGTTGYMAPEQLLGRDSRLGPWTDTYLLGATLYHVLTGHPPHAGVSLEARVIDAATDATRLPALPEDVPVELRRITERALEPDIGKRTAHPEDVRLALATFTQHRGALRLVERGHKERALAASAEERGDETGAERACVAAELAYRAALEEWAECDEAVRGLRELAILRVERALSREDAHAAGRIAEAQQGLPEELLERVARARARAVAEEARLRRIVTDADRGLGHKMRGLLGAVFGLVWVGFWCVVAFVPPATVTPLVGFTLGFTAIGVVVVATRGRQLLENRINRTSMSVIVTGMAATVVWCVGASWLGLDMRSVLIGFLLVSATFASGMATLMDPWGTFTALGFAAAFLAACYRPSWTPYAVVAGNAVLLVNQVVLNIARARRGFETLPRVHGRTGANAPD